MKTSFDEIREAHIRRIRDRLVDLEQNQGSWSELKREDEESGFPITTECAGEIRRFCVALMAKGLKENGKLGYFPKGTGILVQGERIPQSYGILTASHVIEDEFKTRGGLNAVGIVTAEEFHTARKDRDPRLLELGYVTSYQTDDPPSPLKGEDTAYLALTERDRRRIENQGGVFYNLDKSRRMIECPTLEESRPSSERSVVVAMILGVLGYNYRTEKGPESVGGQIPFNFTYQMVGSGKSIRTTNAGGVCFDFPVTHPLEHYGEMGDPVEARIAASRYDGLSGAGYWLIIFNRPDSEPSIETRLNGIVVAQPDREHDGVQCLRAVTPPAAIRG